MPSSSRTWLWWGIVSANLCTHAARTRPTTATPKRCRDSAAAATHQVGALLRVAHHQGDVLHGLGDAGNAGDSGDTGDAGDVGDSGDAGDAGNPASAFPRGRRFATNISAP